MLKQLAEAKVISAARASGEVPLDSDVGMTLAHYRRVISTTAVRAQATCLLTRLGHLDRGAREAAQRRTLAVQKEVALRNEARAYFQAQVRGRGFRCFGGVNPLNCSYLKHLVKF